MQIKKYTNQAIVFNYFFAEGEERETYNSTGNGNIFFEDDTIYSYGYHFPLAVKCQNGYILNGEYYSSSTSAHQGIVRSIAETHWFYETHLKDKSIEEIQEYIKEQSKANSTYMNTRFSFLEETKDPDIFKSENLLWLLRDAEIAHSRSNSEWDEEKRGWVSLKDAPKYSCPICTKIPEHHMPIHHCIIPFSALNGAGLNPKNLVILDVTEDWYETKKVKNKKTGEIEEKFIHHLGASLVREKGKNIRYFSSIDRGSKRHQYYLVQLKSRNVSTVEEAYRDLAGNLSDEQYERYQRGEILRQGEFFLEPHPELTKKDLLKKARKIRIRKIITYEDLPLIIEPYEYGGLTKFIVRDIAVKTPETHKNVEKVAKRINILDYKCIGVKKQKSIGFYVISEAFGNPAQIRHYAYPEHAKQDFQKLLDALDLSLFENKTIGWKAKLNCALDILRYYDLSRGEGNPHIATRAILTDDGVYIQGTLRHPEHKMIRMGNIWHKVYKNTAVNSWTVDGRVD